MRDSQGRCKKCAERRAKAREAYLAAVLSPSVDNVKNLVSELTEGVKEMVLPNSAIKKDKELKQNKDN